MADRERERLADRNAGWTRWAPYPSERAWGTVREDYGADGQAWQSFPTTTPRPGPTARTRTGLVAPLILGSGARRD